MQWSRIKPTAAFNDQLCVNLEKNNYLFYTDPVLLRSLVDETYCQFCEFISKDTSKNAVVLKRYSINKKSLILCQTVVVCTSVRMVAKRYKIRVVAIDNPSHRCKSKFKI